MGWALKKNGPESYNLPCNNTRPRGYTMAPARVLLPNQLNKGAIMVITVKEYKTVTPAQYESAAGFEWRDGNNLIFEYCVIIDGQLYIQA